MEHDETRERGPVPRPDPAPGRAPRPPRRRLRRALRFVVVWIVLLLAAEGTVRVVQSVAGRGADEAPDRFHLYVLGGSSARGVPYDQLPLAGIVADSLGGRVGDRPIAVHVLAQNGASVYAQAVRFERVALSRDPDVPGAVLVYAGHNEPFAPGRDEAPPFVDRLERAVFPVSALGRELFHGLRRLAGVPPRGGLASYGFYLRRIVAAARRSGLVPVLSTVVGNISDVDPNLAIAGTRGRDLLFAALGETPAPVGPGCEAAVEAARRRVADVRGVGALLVWFDARCRASLGRVDEANALYWHAVALDSRSHFGRATPAQNALVRALAAAHDVPLVDAVARFEAAAPDGVIGEALFADGHHPNLDGYVLLATGFAEALSAAFSTPVAARFADGRDYRARVPHRPFHEARALTKAGSWLLAAASGHPWPRARLALAERRFRRAAALAPDTFTPWTGLALAHAGRTGLLLDPTATDRLAAWNVYGSDTFHVPAEDLPALLALLADAGVAEPIRRRVAATHPSAPATQPAAE